ncbi:coiled-coil domain-containing protein 43 [Drosophila sulfurigaster albostrigata]|uniref:Coiled-coil domain-containing protein 43 n=1 Tax=Drosophila albomicans TaxID=7291 RepID=A0A6P8XSI5_DROAB|nr:coiled-coil domain-containing protein 43 [Drosophila albomicans]XP_060665992.1 coiled-coil domain-containing protein 43 [Drosophila nasuta]XP_062121264.1 coiled-coil domain-containing protein 43 [Drosophila sulfurigaster albostrigata]
MSEFETWLNTQLRLLNTDESVFGAYIIGILEGEEESQEEKIEALEGILSETGSANIEELVASILQKWLQSHPSADEPPKKGLDIDVNAQLAKLLEQQKLQPAAKEREYTDEERRIKQQILAQYSQTAVSEEEDDDSDGEGIEPSGSGGIMANTNKADVANLAKEKREQARLESAAKKQKDKEDREKQKQLREEKKEKRKTVKGERRR